MLLLDENLPLGLSGLLRKLGQDCDTTQARGWRELSNGMLVEAASRKWQVSLDICYAKEGFVHRKDNEEKMFSVWKGHVEKSSGPETPAPSGFVHFV